MKLEASCTFETCGDWTYLGITLRKQTGEKWERGAKKGVAQAILGSIYFIIENQMIASIMIVVIDLESNEEN